MVEFIERNKAAIFAVLVTRGSPPVTRKHSNDPPNGQEPKGNVPNFAVIVSATKWNFKTLEKHDFKNTRHFLKRHGANLGEGGSSALTERKRRWVAQEGWVRVPTVFSMPGVIPEGKSTMASLRTSTSTRP